MSESLRNDGRIWVPKKMEDVMKLRKKQIKPIDIPEEDRDYYLERRYPAYGNLVPRDVASRAAKERCDAGFGVNETGLAVFLDFATAIKRLGKHVIEERYGNLFQMYEKIVDENPYETPMPVHFIETTRGCPFDCEFCSVTIAFGGKYRSRPVDEVVDEVKKLRPFEGRFKLDNCVFFVDDNIFSNRVYARELLTRVADLKINWFSHASINIANDPEMLRLCQNSGCGGLLIGFETLSPSTMKTIGKKPNHPEHYLEIVKKIHDFGVGIDASFVFGFDTDDEGVFDRTLEFVHKAKIEIPYYSILTPYPGTRLHKRLCAENRILTSDWSLYDTNHGRKASLE